ncbi:16S rRNA (guanine(966)-N(2))-methyltransferase RsmD [Candidatus Phytoplasma solani]|uniref:N6-adenine-specific methylase n=1 Tax=Candidatus Phytoplasma solani TaxID=69896 RepID=A0A421NXM1_9MOLU|nr:16S rRNA (guanine(966)-N(2))-methyltransferase RsmD [Candidatus Phytoplasma solani]RMI88742.1 N6-adenine-specific methylase [Candidatus Phytoplasma solani]CCP88279.1 N6-adenine-specific methylase [Candidatus Phytoplasma solani]
MTKTTNIIGGKYKGHKIKLVPSLKTKATSSLVKEALFNILGNSIENKKILDLFSGNGSYGFEALSRNAKQVFFVDFSFKAFQTLKENQKKLKLNLDKIVIYYSHYLLALKKFQKLNFNFDFVILDPPYFKNLYLPAFENLGAITHLESIVICELHHKVHLPSQIKEFVLFKEKKYGNKKLQFYRKN